MTSEFATKIEYYGTEKEFIATVVSYITGLSDKITCSTDLDTEFSGSDLTHIPEIVFSVGGAELKLKRTAPLSGVCYSYNIINGQSSIACLFDGRNPTIYTTVANRHYWISDIICDDFILLSIVGDAWGGPYSGDGNIIYVASSGSTYNYSFFTDISSGGYTKARLFDISSRIFKNSSNPSIVGTFLSRFSYGAPPGKIDYIKSTIYQNQGTKVFESTSIFDCTTVTVGDTVSLKDGPYLAVGPHQLIKI